MTRGLYVDPHAGRVLFADHAAGWMASRNVEATTTAREVSVMRTHVLPQWGGWPIAKIDHASIQLWVTGLGRRHGHSTVSESYRLVAGVLKSAVRNRLIAFNPADDIRLPRRRRRDGDDRIISPADFHSVLLPAIPARYRAFVATAGGCGLRWGEAAGLCVDALDLDGGELHVIRTVIEVSGNTSFKPFPKSSAGRRRVPLPPWLTEALRAHLASYPTGDNGLIFSNMVGMPLRRTLFRARVWRPALARAGLLGRITEPGEGVFRAEWVDEAGQKINADFGSEQDAISHLAKLGGPALRFHDLRHSYATWLVDDGVPINMVQRVMGHERATTLDLYTRRTDDQARIVQALTARSGADASSADGSC
jgi:integrase